MLLPSEIQWIKNFVKRKVSEPCFQQGTMCENYHPRAHSLQSQGQRTGVCVMSSWECRITVLMPLVASLVSTHLVRIPNLLYGMIHRTTLLKAKFHTYRILYPNHICLLTVSSLWTCLKTGPINVSGFYLRQSDNLRWASFTSAKSFCLYQESILLSDTCRYGEGTHHPKLLVCRYPSIARDQCRRVQKP